MLLNFRKRNGYISGFAFALFVTLLSQPGPTAAQSTIVVASTTSTEQSGLFRHLLPIFLAKTGVTVRVVALGTGQALEVGKRGDADVVFVHDRAAEEEFVAAGHGVKRHPVMYNDFVLIGSRKDPAQIAGGKDIVAALSKIAANKSVFISRGDDSGTHKAELRLWMKGGFDPRMVKSGWYKETGSGMGPALNTAAALNAYILADRGTWLAFRNRQELDILLAGDSALFNQYGVILVNPTRHKHVKQTEGQAFIDWLIGQDGQRAIADYKISGEQLFFPNAHAQSG